MRYNDEAAKTTSLEYAQLAFADLNERVTFQTKARDGVTSR